jgi:DivIVA domain-containing protein
MPLTPEDVRNRQFKTANKPFSGYDEAEVDTFLDEVEVELSRLLAETSTLRQRAEAALNAPPPQPVASEAEEMLRRTLLLAQRTADETVAAAQQEAQRMTEEARTQAAATIQAAQNQAAASIGDLERRRQALEQHIEGLRAFEREYRTRLRAYLESQLHELEGRANNAPADEPASAPPAPSVPPVPPVPAMAAPAMAAPTPVAAPVSPVSPVSPVPSVYGEGEPEPFDVEDDDGGVPRLAP